jgi:cytochrome oxidase Cu insertion factor (SCO1/SenC/PrrC family)
MKTPIAFFISLVIAGGVAYAVWQGAPERENPTIKAGTRTSILASGATPAKSSGQLPIGGSFSLIDMDGKTVTDKNLHGSFALIFFGFTSCPDICPTTLQAMTVALNKLGGLGEKVRPVFITVDPETDTPAVMKDYIKTFHPRLLALTGTAQQTEAAAEVYRVFHRAEMQKAGEKRSNIDHSGLVYLVSPTGEYLTHFAPNESAEKMMVELTRYLR